MARIISPNEDVPRIENPLIFLAGPILSGPKWHEKAIEYLFSKEENITIASPHRPNGKVIDSEKFARQRAWENYHMDIARKGKREDVLCSGSLEKRSMIVRKFMELPQDLNLEQY